MSTRSDRPGSEARPRPWRSLLLGRLKLTHTLGLVTLVLLGALSVVRVQGEDRSSVSDRPSPVISGALELFPLQGWIQTPRVPRLEGLEFQEPVVLSERNSGTRLVAGVLPATSTMLLPPEFVRRLRVPPARPETVKLGPGIEAYHFAGLVLADGRGLVDVYVLPTTAGVATFACVGGSGILTPHYDCWRNAATLKLRRERALRLGPDAAFRQRLPGAVTAIEQARQQARADLATQVPVQQAAAASTLAGTLRAQAASLAPLAPASRPWSRVLVRELARAGRAYRGVAAALRNADPVAFRDGERVVHARERRIRQLLTPPAGE